MSVIPHPFDFRCFHLYSASCLLIGQVVIGNYAGGRFVVAELACGTDYRNDLASVTVIVVLRIVGWSVALEFSDIASFCCNQYHIDFSSLY